LVYILSKSFTHFSCYSNNRNITWGHSFFHPFSRALWGSRITTCSPATTSRWVRVSLSSAASHWNSADTAHSSERNGNATAEPSAANVVPIVFTGSKQSRHRKQHDLSPIPLLKLLDEATENWIYWISRCQGPVAEMDLRTSGNIRAECLSARGTSPGTVSNLHQPRLLISVSLGRFLQVTNRFMSCSTSYIWLNSLEWCMSHDGNLRGRIWEDRIFSSELGNSSGEIFQLASVQSIFLASQWISVVPKLTLQRDATCNLRIYASIYACFNMLQ
jgi:hypothetical protein